MWGVWRSGKHAMPARLLGVLMRTQTGLKGDGGVSGRLEGCKKGTVGQPGCNNIKRGWGGARQGQWGSGRRDGGVREGLERVGLEREGAQRNAEVLVTG